MEYLSCIEEISRLLQKPTINVDSSKLFKYARECLDRAEYISKLKSSITQNTIQQTAISKQYDVSSYSLYNQHLTPTSLRVTPPISGVSVFV